MLNTTLFGFLLLSRGIGNVLSTPISTALFQGGGSSIHVPKVGFDVDGGKYQKMIVYVGTCFAGAAVVSAAGWGVDKRGRR
jgi:MFS transporter, MCT family, solute carrier family 16 (monocarboxylic acid transporters), member 10